MSDAAIATLYILVGIPFALAGMHILGIDADQDEAFAVGACFLAFLLLWPFVPAYMLCVGIGKLALKALDTIEWVRHGR